jgi:hypothetical protein
VQGLVKAEEMPSGVKTLPAKFWWATNVLCSRAGAVVSLSTATKREDGSSSSLRLR